MKSLNRIAMAAALTAGLLPLGAQAQGAAKNDAGITHQQADDILTELRQIRLLLEKQNAPKGAPEPAGPIKAKLNLEGAQMMGSKDAPITMVEFTDYQCPFCQRFHLQVFSEIKKLYIDTGKVRFYSKDMPLDSLHPNAIRASQAARCAADQGQFWKLRDIMGAHPEALDLASLVADATQLKMNPDTFRSCVETGKYKDAVQADVLEAMRVGADGTPAFIVGKSTSDGVDGELLVGAMPLPIFENRFKDLGVTK